MTKLQMKIKFNEVCKEYQPINDRLLKLMQDKRITYGNYLIHSMYDNYHLQEILNDNKNKLTKQQIEYHLKNFIKDMNEMKSLVEEQETLPFEQTQMQVLLKNEVNA